MSQHASLAPSKSSQWLNCPGSIPFEDQLIEEGLLSPPEGEVLTDYQQFGINGHDWAAKYLNKKCKLADIPEDYRDYVKTYAYKIREIRKRLSRDAQMEVEKKLMPLKWTKRSVWGTADVLLWDEEELHIIDLKLGFIPVDVFQNLQLTVYTLLAIAAYDLYPKRIMHHIYQPRARDGAPDWKTSPCDRLFLDNMEEEVKIIADLIGFNMADNLLRPGEKQCQWCKCRPFCRQAETALPIKAFGQDPKFLSIKKASELLRLQPVADKFFSAVHKRLFKKKMEGGQVPGWKLVEARTNRKVEHQEEVTIHLEEAGISAERYLQNKLMGVTKLQKDKEVWEIVEPFVVKAAGAPILVVEEDPRPAITDEDEEASKVFATADLT